jgi:hypothetical protein
VKEHPRYLKAVVLFISRNIGTRKPFPKQKLATSTEKTNLDTLINEEALLLARFLRNERKEWNPRIGLF